MKAFWIFERCRIKRMLESTRCNEWVSRVCSVDYLHQSVMTYDYKDYSAGMTIIVKGCVKERSLKCQKESGKISDCLPSTHAQSGFDNGDLRSTLFNIKSFFGPAPPSAKAPVLPCRSCFYVIWHHLVTDPFLQKLFYRMMKRFSYECIVCKFWNWCFRNISEIITNEYVINEKA